MRHTPPGLTFSFPQCRRQNVRAPAIGSSDCVESPGCQLVAASTSRFRVLAVPRLPRPHESAKIEPLGPPANQEDQQHNDSECDENQHVHLERIRPRESVLATPLGDLARTLGPGAVWLTGLKRNQRVSVTFVRPAGRSTSPPRSVARRSAVICPGITV